MVRHSNNISTDMREDTIENKCKMYMFSLWNRPEKLVKGSLFFLFIKLLQINFISADNVHIYCLYLSALNIICCLTSHLYFTIAFRFTNISLSPSGLPIFHYPLQVYQYFTIAFRFTNISLSPSGLPIFHYRLQVYQFWLSSLILLVFLITRLFKLLYFPVFWTYLNKVIPEAGHLFYY